MNILRLSCREAKKQDLVEYLAYLGHAPRRVKNHEHWYLSPLRKEDTPSFKVDKRYNIWYDHGIGEGGTIIDFGIRYHRCTIQEFLQILDGRRDFSGLTKSIDQPKIKETHSSPVLIRSVGSIDSPYLLLYLSQRNIPTWLAGQYCRQVDLDLHGKHISALGFPNRSGGYELRNPNFKGSSHPKDLSFLDYSRDEVAVFEGFFSFLSYLTIQEQVPPLTNFLILNSLAFLEKARPVLEKHSLVDLFLDNDQAGKQSTVRALQWDINYRDQSDQFAPHKDWNDHLRAMKQHYQQDRGRRRHL